MPPQQALNGDTALGILGYTIIGMLIPAWIISVSVYKLKRCAGDLLRRRVLMENVEIIRLNVGRYRRLLQTELDATLRQPIQRLLQELEAKLQKIQKRRQLDPRQC